jgi:hypothetical protein
VWLLVRVHFLLSLKVAGRCAVGWRSVELIRVKAFLLRAGDVDVLVVVPFLKALLR